MNKNSLINPLESHESHRFLMPSTHYPMNTRRPRPTEIFKVQMVILRRRAEYHYLHIQ